MRSTRAIAAVARLNARSGGCHYMMTITGTGLFKLSERIEGVDRAISEPLPLDSFVRLVDSIGPQKVARITKSEAAFMKQLVKKDPLP
jgi:hypothetical protein